MFSGNIVKILDYLRPFIAVLPEVQKPDRKVSAIPKSFHWSSPFSGRLNPIVSCTIRASLLGPFDRVLGRLELPIMLYIYLIYDRIVLDRSVLFEGQHGYYVVSVNLLFESAKNSVAKPFCVDHNLESILCGLVC